MTARLGKRETVDIIDGFTVRLERMQDLAAKYGVTRQAIWKLLHRHGVETPKESSMAVSCSCCGKEIIRPRSKLRKNKDNFCDYKCQYTYWEARQEGTYIYDRQGMRTAREVVSQYFDLEPGNIVHHEDRNTRHNHPRNLKVFRNQGDHSRYHRLGKEYSQPIWDGSTL